METLSCWILKPNQGQSGNGETKPMENLHKPLCTFKCRKVIMHEYPCINVLSAAMLACWNRT